MSAEEPGSRRPWVEKPCGSETHVDVADGALVTRDLEVKLADVVFEASDPAEVLCMAVASLLLALTNEFREFLNEVSDFGRAGTGKRRADHADDRGGKGA